MGQMVQANAVVGGNDMVVGRPPDRAAMHGRGKLHRAAPEQPDMVLGPVIGPLIMLAQHVVPHRKLVDIGAGRNEFRLNEGQCLRAQTFIVIQKQDPFMGALRQGKRPCLFHGWRPRNRDDAVHQAAGGRDCFICRRFVDQDDLIGDGKRPQAGRDDAGPVVGDHEGAQAGTRRRGIVPFHNAFIRGVGGLCRATIRCTA